MNNTKRLPALLGVSLLCCLLTACSASEDFSDLHNYLATLKQKAAKKGDLLDHVYFREALSFNGTTVHSPFPQTSTADILLLNKPPIERYPVDAIHLLGIVQQGNRAFAVMQTPDNKTYQVGVGDNVGNQDGKITVVSAFNVTLVEPADPSTGRLNPRTLNLPLQAS